MNKNWIGSLIIFKNIIDLETKKFENHLFEQMVGNYLPSNVYSQNLIRIFSPLICTSNLRSLVQL